MLLLLLLLLLMGVGVDFVVVAAAVDAVCHPLSFSWAGRFAKGLQPGEEPRP